MFQLYSPNMLKTYSLCPKKFYLRYIKNISMPVNDEIFEMGKNIHALASYYLRKENIHKLEEVLSEREKEIWLYLKSLKYFSYEVINTEYNLSVKIGENFFGGRLDALLKQNDTYYILDYKTGAVPKNVKFDFQTMIYMMAVKVFYNTNNVKFVYLDLKHREDFVVELTSELVAEYEAILKDTAFKIKTDEFLKKTNCSNCEYEIICY